MGRQWRVEIEGEGHLVEAAASPGSRGFCSVVADDRPTVTVDGSLVDAPGAVSWLGTARERHFSVCGKPAVLRKTGLIVENYELFVDGKMIPHDR